VVAVVHEMICIVYCAREIHVFLCIIVMLLVTVDALRFGKPWKARSLASFWW